MQPVKKRYIILDALRGFALLGICLANYPEFSLYSFLSAEDAAALQTPGLDRALRYLLAFFVDGKFYTIFSLLLSRYPGPWDVMVLITFVSISA